MLRFPLDTDMHTILTNLGFTQYNSVCWTTIAGDQEIVARVLTTQEGYAVILLPCSEDSLTDK